MSDSKFCFLWDNHSKQLSVSLMKLYENHLFVDIYISCEDQTIGVHKCVLAAGSVYFQEQFQMHPESDLIFIRSIGLNTLKLLLEFVYKGEIYVRDENVDAVLEAAKFLKITGLSGLDSDKIGAPEVLRDHTEWILPEFVTRSKIPSNICNMEVVPAATLDIEQVAYNEKITVENYRPFGEDSCESKGDIKNEATSFGSDNIQEILNVDSEKSCPILSTAEHNESEVYKEESERSLMSILSEKSTNLEYKKEDIALNEVIPEISNLEEVNAVSSNALVINEGVNSSTEDMYEEEHLEEAYLDDDIVLDTPVAAAFELEDEIIPLPENHVYESSQPSPCEVEPEKAIQVLQEAGVPTDVPIYCEGSDGSYVQLTKDVLAEIASGGQVIYQVVDEEGKAGELLLGTAIKRQKSLQKNPTNTVYDSLVGDALHSSATTPLPVVEESYIIDNETNSSTPEPIAISQPNDIVDSVVENKKSTIKSETNPKVSDSLKLELENIASSKPIRNRKQTFAISSEFVTPKLNKSRRRKLLKPESHQEVEQIIPDLEMENNFPECLKDDNSSTGLINTENYSSTFNDSIEQRIAELHMEHPIEENLPNLNTINNKEETTPPLPARNENEDDVSIVKSASLKRKRFKKFVNKRVTQDPVSPISPVGKRKLKRKSRTPLSGSLRKDSGCMSDTSVQSTGNKNIPFALGLLPLKKALQKIQNMSDHTPRKTRSNNAAKNEDVASDVAEISAGISKDSCETMELMDFELEIKASRVKIPKSLISSAENSSK